MAREDVNTNADPAGTTISGEPDESGDRLTRLEAAESGADVRSGLPNEEAQFSEAVDGGPTAVAPGEMAQAGGNDAASSGPSPGSAAGQGQVQVMPAPAAAAAQDEGQAMPGSATSAAGQGQGQAMPGSATSAAGQGQGQAMPGPVPSAAGQGQGQAMPGSAASAGEQVDGRADEGRSFLDPEQRQTFSTQWSDVQARFVDQPRQSVEQADALVLDIMKWIAAGFARERERLEDQWRQDGDVSTEDLRVALTRYRSFFDRLLSA